MKKTLKAVLLLTAVSFAASSAHSEIMLFDNLIALFKEHQGNISDKWENYLATYDGEFHKYRVAGKVRLLEIGVQNGGSLQIWKKYFGNDSEIVGLDIDQNVCKMNLGTGIETFCFDATDREKLNPFSVNKPFDIIIDDGSHMCAHVIESFKALFSQLKAGGIFVVEDVHTSYWESFGGGLRTDVATIEYFKKLLDLINIFHIKDENFIKSLSTEEVYFYKWVESIKFVDSMIIIQKRKTERNEPVKRIMTGVDAPVNAAGVAIGKKDGWFDNAQKMK